MPFPSIPARPAPYTGGEDENSGQSTTKLPFIQNAPRIDARGWMRPLMRLIKPSGAREQIQRTDVALQSGPAPQVIVARYSDKSHGKTGPNSSSLPYTGGFAYIPHQNINRRTAGKAIPALRTIANDAAIPAIYAGNPSKG